MSAISASLSEVNSGALRSSGVPKPYFGVSTIEELQMSVHISPTVGHGIREEDEELQAFGLEQLWK